jgi:hypothetical protein
VYKLALVSLLSSGLLVLAQTSPAARPPVDPRQIHPVDRIRTRIDERRTFALTQNRHPLR